ncbi:pickpocket protein 19-like [Linepithema humile]|uniref:pickpocket protein 19-like n=1 Tax=Linepithema humile TaxID=83485 RepID=UPI00351DABBE
MKSGPWKLRKLTKVARNAAMRIKPRGKKIRVKRFNIILQALHYFCTQTSLHGLRYVVDPDLHGIERFLWLVLFVIFCSTASKVIVQLADRFQVSHQWKEDAPTSINIESMSYETSNLPFPSVTLCPNDRVDWNRALELESRILPNDAKQADLKTFRKILGRLSMMSFGDFDELTFLKNQNVSIFSDINITEVLREVMPRCDDLLSECWWRNGDRNCCEIFEVQKTEYGFCYSFNSELSQTYRPDPLDSRPRKASGYGDWSGVRVTIHLGNITKPPDSTEIEGVIVIINGPNVWPNSGTMIPAGSMSSMSLGCISGYATEGVLELDSSRIPCEYDEKGDYNQESCLSRCKRHYVNKKCGCYPSFLFATTAGFRECTIEDFICLSDNNDLFNDYIVHFDDGTNDISSMICDCSPECDYYIYSTQFSNVPLRNVTDVMLDVHYMGQTSFRYKTDIVITQMDLLVSFGGIIGLFLGGSLLSAAEIVYYLMVAMFTSLRSRQRIKKKPRPSSATVVRTAVLPILDYGPVKPRAKQIPIFANYGPAESNLNRYRVTAAKITPVESFNGRGRF